MIVEKEIYIAKERAPKVKKKKKKNDNDGCKCFWL